MLFVVVARSYNSFMVLVRDIDSKINENIFYEKPQFLVTYSYFGLLLPPIRAAEIVECVRKYMDRSSQNLQNLNPY